MVFTKTGLLFVTFLVIGFGITSADVVPALSQNILLNTTTTNYQNPDVAFDGDRYLTVWSQTIGGGYQVFGRFIRQDGTVEDLFQISHSPSGEGALNPEIAFDGTNYLVIWERFSGWPTSIGGAIVNKTGIVSPEITISSVAYSKEPDVAGLDGKFLVVWEDQRNYNYSLGYFPDIYGQFVESSGVLDGLNFNISTPPEYEMFPTVVAGDTEYLVVWGSDYYVNAGNRDLYGAIISPTGLVSNRITITTDPGVQCNAPPGVAFDGTNYLVVWGDYPPSGTGIYDRVNGVRVNKAGQVIDSIPITLISKQSGTTSAPQAAFDGQKWVVVRGGNPLYGTMIEPTSMTIIDYPEDPLSKNSYCMQPHIASNEQGQSVVVWVNMPTFSSPYEKRAQMYYSTYNPVANAGSDQVVRHPQPVLLDGSTSFDPDGSPPLQYAWSFISRPPGSSVELVNPTLANPSFIPDFPGDYQIQLKVQDNLGAVSAPDLVNISSVAEAVLGEWTLITTAGPVPSRSNIMTAYDSARDRVVLFGGFNGGALNDTWEWDGTRWIQIPTVSAPPGRYCGGLSYDSARGVTVLFGGYNGNIALNDTWVWDGTCWTQMATSGPLPRFYLAMGYDDSRDVMVVFGGSRYVQSGTNSYTQQDFGDTWEWNGSEWKQVATSGPSPRQAFTIAYDSQRGKMVLFGGLQQGNPQYLADTWEWNGTSWLQVASTGPSGRFGNGMAFDSNRLRTVMYGGRNSIGIVDDTWEWDGKMWHQIPISGPSPSRFAPRLVYDIDDRSVVLFGGNSLSGLIGDTWAYQGTDTTPTNQPPAANDDSVSTLEDVPVTVTVLANDSDPDGDSLTAVLVNEPSNGTLDLNADGSFTYTPNPGFIGTDTFTYKANDGQADSNGAMVTITVIDVNVAPVLDPIGAKNVDEGSLLTFTATATDSDLPAQTLTFSLGTTAPAGAAITAGGDFTWTPTEAQGPESYTFDVRVSDGELTDSVTITVTVNEVNDAPVLDPIGAKNVDEGSLLTFTATATDSDLPAQTLTFSLGATAPVGAAITAGGDFTWTPTEEQGSCSIEVIVSDGELTDSEIVSVTVNEVSQPPSDSVPPLTRNFEATPNPVPVNTAVTVLATLDDSSTGGSLIKTAYYLLDGTSYPMSPSDGAFDEPIEDVTVTIAGFDTAGVHTIAVTATDAAGNTAQSEDILLAVYDPSGGFVTGGGWIMSPPGAYYPDPAMTGKATFGFVSKYQKGANVPTGQTEFQFKTGNLNFKSTSYDWLVVAGPKAQYKGLGTINGAGEYGFMLTAIDGAINGGGGTDKFRIKIWEKATDAIVYDNQLNAADTSDPTTVLGGGSIVIHTK